MNQLFYYASLYGASAGFLKLAGFCLFLWLARTLSVEDYATWGLLYALQTGLITFGLVGIVQAIVGLLKVNRSVEKQRQLFAAAHNVFFLTLGSSIAFVLILFVAFLGRTDISFLTLASILISGALLAYSSLQAEIVRLEEKHFSSLCFNFLVPFMGLIGSFVAFLLEKTIQSFFWGSTIGLLISIVAARITGVGFYATAPSLVAMRPILVRVAPFIAVTLLGWLSGYGNNYVIKLFFDSAEVAKFTFTFMLCAIMQLIATSMNQVWGPRFYRMIHDLPFDQVEEHNWRFFRLQGIALGLVGGTLIALLPSTMKVLGGNLTYYESVSLELSLLVSAYVVLIPWWHCQNYLLAYDKGPLVMRVHLITGVIGTIAWVLFMLLMGRLGIYVGFLVQMLLRAAGTLVAARRHWPLKMSSEGIVGGVLIIFIGFLVSKL